MEDNTEGFIRFQYRQSCITTIDTIYGIGKVKAMRLNSFLFNHPLQTVFHKDFITLLQESKGRNIMYKLFIETKIRLNVAQHIQEKINAGCYQAYRLFQELPTKGQRTHGNAGTPSHHNPYLSLNINQDFYHAKRIEFKRKELLNNARHEELKTFNEDLVTKQKMKKSDDKKKSKLSKQNFFKNMKKS